MDCACDCERAEGASLAQTLHLLNSKSIQDKLSSGGGSASRLSGEKDRADKEKISELYLLAFARQPVREELDVATAYLNKKRKAAGESGEDVNAAEKLAYEDLVWALLNTKEFLVIH